MSLENRIALLESRYEISDLVTRYSLATDEKDLPALLNLFTSDAELCIGLEPDARKVGRDAVREFYKERLGQHRFTFHYPHSILLKFQGLHEAEGTVLAHAELGTASRTVISALRYLDRYRRSSDGHWLIARRVIAQMYVLSAEEMVRGLTEEFRVRWPDQIPTRADFPESVASWASWVRDT